MKRIDVLGQTINQLRVLAEIKTIRGTRLICRCSCGKLCHLLKHSLTSGKTKSCKCLAANNNRKHGQTNTDAWNSWVHMHTRCYNENTNRKENYIDRGIYVCPRYQDFQSFYDDMGDRPKGKSIDRKDNDKSYTCGVCEDCIASGAVFNLKWSTPKEQARNRRGNLWVEFQGQRMLLVELAERFDKPYWLVRQRVIRDGLTAEEAVSR